MRSLGWALIQYGWHPYNKGKFGDRSMRAHTHTHRTPSEDEGRGQGDASTNQGPLKTASQPQQLARGREQLLLQSLQKEPVLRTF